MKTKYYLDEIDVSQLPLPVREQLDKGLEGSPFTAVGFAPGLEEPRLIEKTGEYCTFWMIVTGKHQSHQGNTLSSQVSLFTIVL